jgi:hypothetical protein
VTPKSARSWATVLEVSDPGLWVLLPMTYRNREPSGRERRPSR